MVSKQKMGCFAALLYLTAALVLPHAILYGFSYSTTVSSWYFFYLLLFIAPAFLMGFLLFVMIDWGLKRILYKPSLLALLPIAIALSVPFIWEHFALKLQHNIIIPIVTSVAMLIWSIFVVGLQYSQNPEDKEEKPKRS